MAIHRVRLMLDGKLVSEEYQGIEARTEKEAAEKLHGGLLFKQGTAEQLRAMVAAPSGSGSPTLFYERDV
jgi:hypothetical protein